MTGSVAGAPSAAVMSTVAAVGVQRAAWLLLVLPDLVNLGLPELVGLNNAHWPRRQYARPDPGWPRPGQSQA